MSANKSKKAPDEAPSGGRGSSHHKRSFLGRMRSWFLAGVLVTAPAGITFYLAYIFVTVVDAFVSELIPDRYLPALSTPLQIPGFGLLILVVSLILVGALAAGFAGRYFVRSGERIVSRMPIVRSVYGAIKQILETILHQQSNAFRQVVLVEYPRRGIWAIGFITGATKGEVQNLIRQDVVNVFLPTTPNPTSGFLLFVPREDLVVLKMTVEEGIKMVVSGGIVTPPDRRPAEEQAQPALDAVAAAGNARSAIVGEVPHPGRDVLNGTTASQNEGSVPPDPGRTGKEGS